MRKFSQITSAVCALCLSSILFTAFTFLPNNLHQETAAPSTSPLAYKIMEVTYLWDLLIDSHEVNRDTDGTWLEEGVRSKYAAAKAYAALPILEEITETKVFNRGPHGADIDLNATYSFGYYNPAFLQKIKEGLQTALQNPAFKLVAQKMYDKHFEGLAITYQTAYHYIQENEEIIRLIKLDYLESLAQPAGSTEGSLQENFRAFADAVEKRDGANWYEAVVAPSFWLRRSIDGTDAQFAELLEMVIEELGAKG